MRLFVKTSLYYLVAGIPALLVAGFVCYWMISAEVEERNKEHLDKRILNIEKLLQKSDSVSLNLLMQDSEVFIENIPSNVIEQYTYSDSLIYDVAEDEFNLNTLLTAVIKTRSGNYTIRVWLKTLEVDEFMEGIIASLFVILILLLMAFILINWWVSRTVWKPFYKTVETLQSFNPSDKEKPALHESHVKEFSELNFSVNRMMDKMITDFKSQKQFTENASHEMQTPLAVIKSKIELLIQSDKLEDKENDLISSIDVAVTKLERLNKSLLLLTKIENHQFNIFERKPTLIDEISNCNLFALNYMLAIFFDRAKCISSIN